MSSGRFLGESVLLGNVVRLCSYVPFSWQCCSLVSLVVLGNVAFELWWEMLPALFVTLP